MGSTSAEHRAHDSTYLEIRQQVFSMVSCNQVRPTHYVGPSCSQIRIKDARFAVDGAQRCGSWNDLRSQLDPVISFTENKAAEWRTSAAYNLQGGCPCP